MPISCLILASTPLLLHLAGWMLDRIHTKVQLSKSLGQPSISGQHLQGDDAQAPNKQIFKRGAKS
jgi:hypothetical protein